MFLGGIFVFFSDKLGLQAQRGAKHKMLLVYISFNLLIGSTLKYLPQGRDTPSPGDGDCRNCREGSQP